MSNKFIAVGENIHCTRIFKVGGKVVVKQDDGSYVITYKSAGKPAVLPIPQNFTASPDWSSGKVKHCAVAIWQANYGNGDDKAKGLDYIQSLAMAQEKAGSSYLDINVDEFSLDLEEKKKIVKWTVTEVQKAVSIPMSIDSSNTAILQAGLEACDKNRAKPMVNSVSLERLDAVKVAASHGAVVIASAAGKTGLPSTMEERFGNIEAIIAELKKLNFTYPQIHVDPLVFPISTDGKNGLNFLETVKSVRTKFGPEIHIVAGLSNVSFGMPNRKLINQTFAKLACDYGADGGIVDPMQINGDIIAKTDVNSREYKLASDLLLGKDEYGMEFITAFRGE